MIKNQRQFKATLKQTERFKAAIDQALSAGNHDPQDSLIRGMRSMLATLERQAREYEALLAGDLSVIKIDGLHGLPAALIKARICRGMSQKDLAALLGVKPQQVQRWEHEDYENISFSRLEEIAEALGLNRKFTLASAPQATSDMSFNALGFDFRSIASHSFNLLAPQHAARNFSFVHARGEVRAADNDGPAGQVAVIQTSSGVRMTVSGLGQAFDGQYDRSQAQSAIPADAPEWRQSETKEKLYA